MVVVVVLLDVAVVVLLMAVDALFVVAVVATLTGEPSIQTNTLFSASSNRPIHTSSVGSETNQYATFLHAQVTTFKVFVQLIGLFKI